MSLNENNIYDKLRDTHHPPIHLSIKPSSDIAGRQSWIYAKFVGKWPTVHCVLHPPYSLDLDLTVVPVG